MAESQQETTQINQDNVLTVQSDDRKKNNDESHVDITKKPSSSAFHLVDTHPECSVCLQPCLQPVLLPCAHIFCFLCVKGFAFRSRRCALCRRDVTLDYFQNPVIVKVQEKTETEIKQTHNKTLTTQTMSLTDVEHYDWFYEGHNGWWQYDERASSVLEDAFQTEARSCELPVAGFAYFIDFCNMIQFRKSNPARCRRIKRDKSNAECKGIAGLKSSDEKVDLEENISEKVDTLSSHAAGDQIDNESIGVSVTDSRNSNDSFNETSSRRVINEQSSVEVIQNMLQGLLSNEEET